MPDHKLGYCWAPTCCHHEVEATPGADDSDADARCLHTEHDEEFWEDCDDFETRGEALSADET